MQQGKPPKSRAFVRPCGIRFRRVLDNCLLTRGCAQPEVARSCGGIRPLYHRDVTGLDTEACAGKSCKPTTLGKANACLRLEWSPNVGHDNRTLGDCGFNSNARQILSIVDFDRPLRSAIFALDQWIAFFGVDSNVAPGPPRPAPL